MPLTGCDVQNILNDLLEEDSVHDAADPSNRPTHSMQYIRHLILRNKADILAKADQTAEEALRLYKEALGIDDKDPNLLSKMGTLVRLLHFIPEGLPLPLILYRT